MPSPRIPLPGAYPRELLPSPRRRDSLGESCRCATSTRTTLALPEGLLVDADTPADLARLERPGHALVVGGTGMLAGLTRALADRGHVVSSVARKPRRLGRTSSRSRSTIAMRSGFGRAIEIAVEERGPIELAVCWIHTDAPEAPRLVAAALAPGARLVQVFGTRRWPLGEIPLHDRLP